MTNSRRGGINNENIPKYSQPTLHISMSPWGAVSKWWLEWKLPVCLCACPLLSFIFLFSVFFNHPWWGGPLCRRQARHLCLCQCPKSVKKKKFYVGDIRVLGPWISTDEAASLTSCTFCRSATMFVRSFCSFSSASFSLTSVLLLFSSTALALASALLWYELHNDWRPDSYCWKYSF